MPEQLTISQLNTPIIINKYVLSKNAKGGNEKTLDDSYSIYAAVDVISSTYTLEQMQVKYGEGYRIKMRYEPSRQITPNDEIVFENRSLKIQSVVIATWANKRYVIILAKTRNSDANI